MDDLRAKLAKGAVVKLVGQAMTLLVKIGSLVVLARLLTPADFGLVAMAVAVGGIAYIIASAGYTMAAIQKEHITEAEVSTLFWINLRRAALIALAGVLAAPLIAAFYGDYRVGWIFAFSGAGLVLTAAGAQHSALLQREMRFTELTMAELTAEIAGATLAISLAVAGVGYWSLVAASVMTPFALTSGLWVVTRWLPGRPDWSLNMRALTGFSFTLMLNQLVVFIAYNAEKVLLGRFWGADVLGLYGRASQIIGMPTAQLHGAVGGVVFSTLSRLQSDQPRFRRYFLKVYALIISLTAPVTMAAVVFAEEIVLVLLGPKWIEAAAIFRLLSPTVLIFGLINPLAWLLLSSGLQRRSLHLALVIAPLCIASYLVGLPYGPKGVALCYSLGLGLWLVPHLLWSIHGTNVSALDLLEAAWWPVLAALGAGLLVLLAKLSFDIDAAAHSLVVLVVGGSALATIYLTILVVIPEQRRFLGEALSILLPARRPSAS